MIDLKNLNIILTGATGVIGNSIVDKLISAGANVLATGTNDQKLKILQDKSSEISHNLNCKLPDNTGCTAGI